MGQGAALTITTLYLRELGWGGAAIGGVLIGSGLVRAGLSIIAPELNALLGPKRYLLFYEALTLAASFIAASAISPWLLAAAMIAAGFGSGHSGSGGPTASIERAWLGAYARDKNKAKTLYGRHALYGYAGLGAGALLACIPMLVYGSSESAGSFRLLYVFIMILTLACLFCIFRIQGGARKPRVSEVSDNDIPTAEPVANERKAEHGNVRMLAGMLSGAAAVLTSTVTSYWFSAKFGASPGIIGAVMAASYFGAALLSLLTSSAADRRGTLKAIAGLQLLAILLLLALPWISSLWIAALLEIACTASSLGTRGNRTALMMEDRKGRSRGSLLSRLYRAVIRLAFILWPGVFVHFIDRGDYVTPFYAAAGIQALSVLLFLMAYGVLRKRNKTKTDRNPIGEFFR